MKLISKLLCLSALLLGVASCDKDYELPPLNEPIFVLPDGASTITISEIRANYAAATSATALTIEDDLYLKATVVGDDRSGNLFKSIILQDETGGISMGIDQSNYYTDYPVGQEVYVELKGLCVSVYGQEQQLGHPDGYLYRTPYEIFKQKVHKNGFAKPQSVEEEVIESFSDFSSKADKVKYTLVRLENVHFEQGGQATYAEPDATTTRVLKDANDNSLDVRTSNYADFAAKQLPTGVGTVVGILGCYNGTWQLTIRTIDDVYGFDEQSSGEDTDDQDGEIKTLPYTESFSASLGDFTIDNKMLPAGINYVWAYDSRFGAKATGYVSGNRYTVESWLVSPIIDLGNAEHPALKFKHAGNYFNGTEAIDCTVMVITADGATHALRIPQYSEAFAWVDAAFALSEFKGQQIQIAFIYKSSPNSAGTWEIKDFEVSDDASVGGGTTDPTPDQPGTGLSLPYEETFATSIGQFTIDDKNIDGLSYVWNHDSKNKYMKASAFVSSVNHATESWLVSPAITIPSSTAGTVPPQLSYEQCGRFFANLEAQNATIAIKGANGQWKTFASDLSASGTSWTWASKTLSLEEFAGQTIQIAFVYKSTTSAAGTWEIRNLVVR